MLPFVAGTAAILRRRRAVVEQPPRHYAGYRMFTTRGHSHGHRLFLGRPPVAVSIGLLAASAALLLATAPAREPRESPARVPAAPETGDDDSLEPRIRRFCADCHAAPRPESFPRDAWHDLVARGYEYYARSGRTDLDPPPFLQTLAFFRSRAPQRLEFPPPPEAVVSPPPPWETEDVRFRHENAAVAPATSSLRWLRLAPEGGPLLVACDMRRGGLTAVDPRGAVRAAALLQSLGHPCHVEVCDLDGDGASDLVVADLGSYFPADHDSGRVLWIRGRSGASSYDVVPIASGLGRVADARPADVDGDGDVDLIVAEFGNDRTGGIHLLRNQRVPLGTTRFDRELLDPRPGTIHVPILDVNADSRPDFVALVSQESEQVDLFLNRGDGRFSRQTLWAAPDVTFAASGIEPADVDGDGDTDLLITNGDAFDDSYVHPSHGVQWLEQQDDLRFVHHRMADLLGAYSARAGDLDLDGDLDVVAATWLPPQVRPAEVALERLPSLIHLEQVSPGEFTRHVLETGEPVHAALELADFDGDGDLDVATGRHILSRRMRSGDQESPSCTIWWNRRDRSPAGQPSR